MHSQGTSYTQLGLPSAAASVQLATDSPQLDDREFVHLVLRRVLGDEGWQMGKTKVGRGRCRYAVLQLAVV